ncbi:MAG: hypothetical protein IH840_00455 [Candidatus Heimdallarchaeota archaeon]|nr:hypothetical protein [Candidatus Heimdallarchaeota archaeon]
MTSLNWLAILIREYGFVDNTRCAEPVSASDWYYQWLLSAMPNLLNHVLNSSTH